jgi:hypothetical protein
VNETSRKLPVAVHSLTSRVLCLWAVDKVPIAPEM